MKRIIHLIALLFILGNIDAQTTPNLINYQAVAHNSSGNLLANQNLTIRIGIVSTSSTGTLQYEEDHTVTTNDYGLFAIQIGGGASTGNGALTSLSAINWSSDLYFLSVSIDAGSGFESLGTMQLVSVPYALNSKNTEQIQNKNVSALTPNNGDIMVYNSSNQSWEYQANTAGSTYTAGNGILINANVISNIGDTDSTNDITNSTIAGGDLSGTYPNPNVVKIQGNNVISGVPNDGDILVYSTTSSSWVYQANPGTTYTAGVGVSITGNTINNIGDTDSTNDITNTTLAGQDLSGIYPNPTVVGIQNIPVSSNVPNDLDVLQYNSLSSQWQFQQILPPQTAADAGYFLQATGTGAVTFAPVTGDGNGIYSGSGTVPTATVATVTDNITFNASATQPVATFSNTNAVGSFVNIDASAAGASPWLNLLQQGVVKGQLTATTNGLRLYGVSGTPRIGINTDPTTIGILQINYAGSNTDPGIYMVNPNNGAATGLNRITMANSMVAGKYWEMAGGVNTSGDAVSAWTVSYNNGTNYKQFLTVYGDQKVAVGNISAANSSTFDVFGTTTMHDALTIDNGTSFPYTLPAADGTANFIMQTDGAGNISWIDPTTLSPTHFSRIEDLDGNTSIETDFPGTGAEDKIHITIAGTEKIVISNTTIDLPGYGQSVHLGTGAGVSSSISTNPRNVFIGQTSGTANTSGNFNTAVGGRSFETNTTGAYNTAIGNAAMEYNTTGGNNTAIGNSALINNSTGNFNTALGTSTLTNNTGSYNTAVGNRAGFANTTGNNNTFIGYNANATANNLTNAGAIGANATISKSNAINIGNGSTFVGINQPSPNNMLSIKTSTSNGFEMQTYGNSFTNMMSFIHYGGTTSTPSSTTAGNIIATSLYSGYGTTTDVIAAKVEVIAEANFTDAISPGAIAFSTTKSGNTFADEKMRITSNGFVGIGTTSPSANLDINGTFKLTDGTQGKGRVLTSDVAGNASWKEGAIAFSVGGGDYGSATQFIASGATTRLQFDITGPSHYDPNAYYSTTNNQFVAPVSGVYQLNTTLILAGATSGYFTINMKSSTGNSLAKQLGDFNSSAQNWCTRTISVTVHLTAGESIWLEVLNSNGSMNFYTQNSTFSGHLVYQD